MNERMVRATEQMDDQVYFDDKLFWITMEWMAFLSRRVKQVHKQEKRKGESLKMEQNR